MNRSCVYLQKYKKIFHVHDGSTEIVYIGKNNCKIFYVHDGLKQIIEIEIVYFRTIYNIFYRKLIQNISKANINNVHKNIVFK